MIAAEVTIVPAPVPITSALALWATWHLDTPPDGRTGDDAADRRLANIFREILKTSGPERRWALIEREVFAAQDFPDPFRPVDLYRQRLIRWWLELYEDAHGGDVQ